MTSSRIPGEDISRPLPEFTAITGGYAKTKEVDIAQELGAGKYIKKPYTLEKIGVAVKKELEKLAVFDPQLD